VKFMGEVSERARAIDDARMEYGHLMTSYMSLANMFWIGFGAFFTINSLLATALGVSYSQSAQALGKPSIDAVRILIPVVGIFISFAAVDAARKIRAAQHHAVIRGRKLEELLSARIFEGLEPYSRKAPTSTIIGSLLFALLWASTLLGGLVAIIG
jgi:hypothetical protein